MGHDNAAFRPEDLRNVWGDMPLCVLTLQWQNVDAQHILGRGYARGVGMEHQDRSIFSSVFNSVPLHRSIHAGPYRDALEMRRLFLRIARERVMNAVQLGTYELNDCDSAFLPYVDELISQGQL